MFSFTNTTIQSLVAGALVLGAGIYYQSYASQRLDEARDAVRKIDVAQARAETTKQRGEQYVGLIASMADRKIDHQEPLSLASEFSPLEISQIGELLGTLYQRDGFFFLQRFRMAWREADKKLRLLPRVVLELEGRKVLLFSNEAAVTASVASVDR
jgi:hypothetical protein